ncbi:MAG: LLM class flavin-dependent oxidoreductase [Dehalococcoidia bacterium]|nr:LLM class flavin-dependent oxidoreductase [Dehalococcoidia bacterium]
MINKFSVLYVGFIELDNVGINGTPSDERRYSNEQIVDAYRMSLEVAQHMDELGYYALWGAEHHFQREGYEVIPNLILWGTYLAARTKQLKLGCAFNVIPVWHPIRLAEDYAMADIMTGGRIIFGVGRGYQTREIETLGAPLLDTTANLELYEEQMEIIFKAFNQDSFSHQGKYYTIPAPVPFRGYQPTEVTLVPRPIHRPVEIWQPIASGKTLPYIAQRGIKGMVTLNGEKITREVFHAYQDEAAKAGRKLELGEDMCLGLGMYIAPTQQEAIELVRPYHDERYKWFAPFGFVRYADENGRPWGTPGAPAGVPRIEDGVQQRAWLCGPPDLLVKELKAYEAEFPGLDQVMIHWPEGVPATEFKRQLAVFAKEVMPHFGKR